MIRQLSMNLLHLFCLLLLGSLVHADPYTFAQQYKGMDFSAAKLCYVLGGSVTQVDPNGDSKGFTCTFQSSIWTHPSEAEDFCASLVPFHILSAQTVDKGGHMETTCTFKSNLVCKDDYIQINGFCYKLVTGTFTFAEAKKRCLNEEPNKSYDSKLAEYYSNSLGLFFEQHFFPEVWVTVPNIKDYFTHGTGEAAVFVLDGAFKYDTKPGTLILDDENSRHWAMCQYKPGMTMAEMYHLAKVYSEIYPVHITDTGVNVATSSYMTITQQDLQYDAKSKKYYEKFNTKAIRERCASIGRILNVESNPMASIEEEWAAARSTLTDHRFYLTSAYKNDGCQLSDYRDYDYFGKTDIPVYRVEQVKKDKTPICNAFSFSFSKAKRLPTMAAMRAPAICTLHSFGFEYDKCPNGWVTFDRKQGTRFCHYVHNEKPDTFSNAKEACSNMDAALSGFESEEEFRAVNDHVKPQNSHLVTSFNLESHYWLGGVIPCKMDCQPGYMASWYEGVSMNTKFLNEFKHDYHPWKDKGNDVIAYRADVIEFHTHHHTDYYGFMWYICGKAAKLIPKKIDTIKLRNT